MIPDWQGAASNVLVSLGMKYATIILDQLMVRFVPGSVPHYFIMKSLGDLFSANPVDTVPKLKEVIARVLPVLASVKQENMRWVFASGIAHFCESILNYVANIENAVDKTITVSTFSSDVFPAYEILFTNWLQSKESKVRVTTMQAIGSMCLVLSKEQLEVQIPKLIPTVLSFYKKEKEHLPITQGFGMILEASVKENSRILDNYLKDILITIHPLACNIPEYSQGSTTVKNYNELLRCIQTLTVAYSDSVITFLLERVNNKDITIRMGTLAIFKHLVSRLYAPLEDKKGLLVTGMKPLTVNETNYIVKKELCNLIITMAAHDYLTLEGGEQLLDFIIKTSAITEDEIEKYKKIQSSKKEDKNSNNSLIMSPEELRSMCDNILNLSTTTIKSTHNVFWPYLFEVIIPYQYTDALGIVTKCLGHIASYKREQESNDYIIDFDRAVNLPKPHAIIARLLVMLNAPLRRGQLGLNILKLLQSIGPIIHPSIYEMWDSAIPKLINYLEVNGNDTKNWNISLWEDLVLRLLTETIKIANEDEWIVQYGEQLAKQIDLYKNDSDMKRIAYKHLGLLLQKSNNKEFIRTKIELMLSTVDSNNELERQGCAQGIGYCSATHLDMTLEKLQGPTPIKSTNSNNNKSSGGLLSFLSSSSSKDKESNNNGQLNNTIILSYGYVSAYAQPSLITSRIDISILNYLKPVMATTKSITAKECIIKSIELIAKSKHPSHLKKEHIFKARDDLLKVVINYISPKEKNETTIKMKIMGLETINSLILLEPLLPVDIESILFERIVPFYTMNNEDSKDIELIINNLNTIMTSLLYMNQTTETLCKLIKTIEPYVRSKESIERERTVTTITLLLKKLVENLRNRETKSSEKEFNQIGACIAMLIPRCTDPLSIVRSNALESIQISLYIDHLLKSDDLPDKVDVPESLFAFKEFKQRITSDELNDQFAVIHDLAKVLSKIINEAGLPQLIINALTGLNDTQLPSTSGTCVFINGLIKVRGQELLSSLSDLVQNILKSMETITNEQTMNGTLHAIRSLAAYHHIPLIDLLLNSTIPHTTFVVKSLQSIVKDPKFSNELIEHLVEVMNKSQLYEESPDPKNKKNTFNVPTHLPMSATCALTELLQLEELEELIDEHYHIFVSTLLLRIGTTNGMVDNTASEQASNAWKQFLICGKEASLQVVMNKSDNWNKLNKNDYHNAITDISTVICKEHPQHMRKIFQFLLPFLKGNFIGQRIVTSTVFAEFINHSKNDKELLQQLVNCILSSLGDPTIKLQSLRGLGNIVSAGTEQANKYAPTVLDALMSCIDDNNDTLALEAMNGLAKVFAVVDEERMAPILINICLRIKPAFDKDNTDIRAASFRLFGTLFRFGNGIAADPFYDQIHNNLPAMILHSNEDNENVTSSCKTALRSLAPLFKSKELEDLLLSNQFDPARQLDFSEFANDLSKLLVQLYPDRINYYVMTCVSYYQSNWSSIKSSAATFSGLLMTSIPFDKRKQYNLNPSFVSKALIELLKEKEPGVRRTAAEAMSLLYNY